MSKLKMVSSFFMIVSLSIFFHLNIFADEFMSEFMSEFITEKEGECNKSSDIEKRFKNYYEKAADNASKITMKRLRIRVTSMRNTTLESCIIKEKE